MATRLVNVKDIRNYIADYWDTNFKYDDFIFTDEEIEKSIELAKELIDMVPPVMNGIGYQSLPLELQIIGVLSVLFRRRYTHLALNYTANINENGLNLTLSEDFGIIRDLAESFRKQFIEEARLYKQSIEHRKSFGSINSPYHTGNGIK